MVPASVAPNGTEASITCCSQGCTSLGCYTSQSGDSSNELNGQKELHSGSILSLCMYIYIYCTVCRDDKYTSQKSWMLHPTLGASVHCTPGFHRANAKELVVP